jgi:hypothetical protein
VAWAGCGLWCVGAVGVYDKNDNSTVSITNAGAKRSYFFAIDKKVQISGVDKKVQILLAGTFLTDSYIEEGQIKDMDFFVHSGDLDFVVEMHPTLAT